MGPDLHERARFLTEEARIAGIAAPDELWLRSHVTDCPACAQHQEDLDAVVRQFQSLVLDVDPAMAARIQEALAVRVRKPSPAKWWGVAAAVLLAVGAVPFYQGARDARREKADALLMEEIENRVSRVVPVAMEPLAQSQSEEAQ